MILDENFRPSRALLEQKRCLLSGFQHTHTCRRHPFVELGSASQAQLRPQTPARHQRQARRRHSTRPARASQLRPRPRGRALATGNKAVGPPAPTTTGLARSCGLAIVSASDILAKWVGVADKLYISSSSVVVVIVVIRTNGIAPPPRVLLTTRRVASARSHIEARRTDAPLASTDTTNTRTTFET